MANGIVLNIDTTKSEFQNPMVQLRQGDGNYQSLSVTVTSNGEPFDLNGWTIVFMGTTAGEHKIIDADIVVNSALQGEFTYTPTKSWGQDQGEFKNAYFKFVKEDETASGASFRVNVLNAVDMTLEEAGDYISVVDDLIDKVKTDLDKKLSETQTSVNELNTNVNELKTENLNIKTSNNTWTGTNTFNLPIVGNISGTATTANDPQAVHIDNFGSIIDFRQPIGTKFIDKLNNEFAQRSINVKWFGAKGDRVTDDTAAFQAAITEAKLNGANTKIIVPSGKYLISQELELEYLTLEGEGVGSTYLFAVNTPGLLLLRHNNVIKNMSLISTLAARDTTFITFGRNDDSGGNILENLSIYGLSDGSFKVTGMLMETYGNNIDQVHGIWPNVIKDVQFFDIYDGIVISPKAYSWINGNSFQNITVHGYFHSGIYLRKGADNAQGLSQNRFDNIQFEALSYTPSTASGLLITYGFGNLFSYIHNWTDGVGLGGSAVTLQTANNTTEFDIRENVFDNAYLESYVSASDNLKRLNLFNENKYNIWTGQFFNKDVSRLHGDEKLSVKNLLPSNLVEIEASPIKETGISYYSPLTSSNVTTGIDSYGAYIAITATSGTIALPINSSLKQALKTIGNVTVGFDFNVGNPDTATIVPGLGYYNKTTNTSVGQSTGLRQAGLIESSQYRMTINYANTGFDQNADPYISLTWSNVSGTLKIRNIFVHAGMASVNNPVISSTQAQKIVASSTNSAPTSFDDLGINTLDFNKSGKHMVFNSGLLTKYTVNGGFVYEYPLYV